MTPQQAKRFAQVSLETFGAEQTFEIGLETLLDLHMVAEAFRDLNCRVAISESRRLLHIDCRDPAEKGCLATTASSPAEGV